MRVAIPSPMNKTMPQDLISGIGVLAQLCNGKNGQECESDATHAEETASCGG